MIVKGDLGTSMCNHPSTIRLIGSNLLEYIYIYIPILSGHTLMMEMNFGSVDNK